MHSFWWEEFMDRRHMQVLDAERKMPFKASLELSLLKIFKNSSSVSCILHVSSISISLIFFISINNYCK